MLSDRLSHRDVVGVNRVVGIGTTVAVRLGTRGVDRVPPHQLTGSNPLLVSKEMSLLAVGRLAPPARRRP
jgi:hypothetical protein